MPLRAELRKNAGKPPTVISVDMAEPREFSNGTFSVLMPQLVGGAVKSDCPGEPTRARFTVRVHEATAVTLTQPKVDLQGARPLSEAASHPLLRTMAKITAQVKSAMTPQCGGG